MIVNNLQRILPNLIFGDPDTFYFVQIIKRRKENDQMKDNNKLVKSFHISTREELITKFAEIQSLCKFHNARAYIDLNRRSFEKTAYLVLQKVTTALINKTYRSIKSIYDTACNEHTIEVDKLWLIDVDIKNEEILEEIMQQINCCNSEFEEIVIKTIPTLNGWHIITHKFNYRQLEPYQCIQPFDVHKHGKTLLYYEGTHSIE